MLKFTPPGRTVAPSGELRPVLSITFSPADASFATRPRLSTATVISLPPSQQLFRCRRHPVRLKAEFSLELFDRRQAAKRLIAVVLPGLPTISFHSEGRGRLAPNRAL